MKYILQLNNERKTVSIEPEGLRYEQDAPIAAELTDVEGSPVRMVRLGTNVYRVVVEKLQGRGDL